MRKECICAWACMCVWEIIFNCSVLVHSLLHKEEALLFYRDAWRLCFFGLWKFPYYLASWMIPLTDIMLRTHFFLQSCKWTLVLSIIEEEFPLSKFCMSWNPVFTTALIFWLQENGRRSTNFKITLIHMRWSRELKLIIIFVCLYVSLERY